MAEDGTAHDPVPRLMQAMRTSSPVVLTYQGADQDRPHRFMLYPRRLFGRYGHRYVEGWSPHCPSRIRFRRSAHGDPGCVRQFRLDRMIACEPPPPRPRTLAAYVVAKIQRRGIAMALVGWFWDLVAIGMLIGLALSVLRVVGF